ncbi:SDR family oxidoreductase [Kiloniella litopenaei]|uniref:SDR family oxidoreductase n=1 Tax=Kiloniella litopenaei TaxID=1549748 RepID=UPI003BA99152
MSKLTIKDLVVFITGANREKGIGRALVEEALKRGAKKVYATARDVSQLDGLVQKYEGRVVAVGLDVTNPEQIQKAVQEAGDTQVLINNAGVAGFSGCIFNYDEKAARQEFEVNCFAPLHLMNAFSDSLIKNGNGAIVNVVSIAGLASFPLAATYSASKAALHSLTRAARIEMARHGVPVFGVYPGPIDTDMAARVEAFKESPANLAGRVFDGMEAGVEDITTDPLADAFAGYLKEDPVAAEAMKKEFGIGNHH